MLAKPSQEKMGAILSWVGAKRCQLGLKRGAESRAGTSVTGLKTVSPRDVATKAGQQNSADNVVHVGKESFDHEVGSLIVFTPVMPI